MFVAQVPCATSTSSLVATAGMSGLGARRMVRRRRGVRGYQAVPCKQFPTSALLPVGMSGPRPMRAPILTQGGPGVVSRGGRLSGLGCQCNKGLGDGLTMDGTGLFGTGLFSGGFDTSNWTWAEWAAVIFGGYVFFSVFHTTRTVTRKTRKGFKAARSAK